MESIYFAKEKKKEYDATVFCYSNELIGKIEVLYMDGEEPEMQSGRG